MTSGPSRTEEAEQSARELRHELRTPLNQIIGYAEMLREEAEDAQLESFVSDLRKIESAAWRLLRFIDKLSLSPARSAQMEQRLEALDTQDPERQLELTASGDEARSEDEATRQTLPRLEEEAPSSATILQEELLSLDLDSGQLFQGVRTQSQSPSKAERRSTVLVVDDNPMNLDMLARRLELRGLQVSCASGGREALGLLEKLSFELVLLDVLMPDINGLEVLTIVRRSKSPAELPIIMATACNESEDVVRALRLGANDYVTKPLDFEVVLARVHTQLSLKRNRDSVLRLHEQMLQLQQQVSQMGDELQPNLWSSKMSQDISLALGARDVEIWAGEPEHLQQLAGSPSAPPSAKELADLVAGARDKAGRFLFPISNAEGERFGRIAVLRDDDAKRWSTEEQHLLSSVSRQLASSIEMRRLRRELGQVAQARLQQEESDDNIEFVSICPECERCFPSTQLHCDEHQCELEALRKLPLRLAARYRLQRVLGEGGMGMVFEALDERLERAVAIKLIKSQHFHDAAIRIRFANEAKTLARIDHPNVIAIYDSGELPDGSLFIVMELLRGVALSTLLRKQGSGSPAQVAALARQGASGLSAAHRAGLVHRDIKPDNIFLLPQGDAPTGTQFVVKLLDFGVAKELSSDSALTHAGHLVGTPLYMSPEQLATQAIDQRSDLFSFASVIYESLCGVRPIRAKDLFAIIMEVIEEQALPPTAHRPRLDPLIDQVFALALAKSPEERPACVSAWVDAFAEILAEQVSEVAGWSFEARGEPSPDDESDDENDDDDVGATRVV
ncbi:MAG: protein kinase [Myxococcota bacterium]|jgi:DNA-binding response OmpR family regulator/tRNA A-37 threonylcarbamoyl transferase component Bud32|nr:protein kinase [Myxococcota bacterium]